ncbi:sensor histidine kinase [Maritimibacter dapengensis]|uniref:histidine kinase n=1 Tax=Maritimibacter dapengensis TaxID=2836868 RepID=A0ABS6SWH3_9RHOB|nr:sensor histidine kinase [Maritimibacter dapengensis]MBV7377303.1 sensor histidine kinase [Maritimibacter dapengensis]
MSNDGTDVVLGEDWVDPESSADAQLRARRARKKSISVNRSPLARKIITFNLLGLVVLVAGVLYLNPVRDSLVAQRERALVSTAELVAEIFEVQQTVGGGDPATDDESSLAGSLTPALVEAVLSQAQIYDSGEITIFNADGEVLGGTEGLSALSRPDVLGLDYEERSTIITDFLSRIWEGVAGLVAARSDTEPTPVDSVELARELLPDVYQGNTRIKGGQDTNGATRFTVVTPISVNGNVEGAVAMTTIGGELDLLVRAEREQVLQMFVIAILVSIGLSLVLASTIANPLADLAAAAEIGRDKNSGAVNTGRVRIPDLSGRPDEIGRLSKALRGMVSALYDRIDANEQFAADVAHEIKNPLASLRSAVGTLRMARKEEQRDRLLDVIDHDVRRLDRLVSDISNASRLDSELVKEEEEAFDLLKMIRNLTEYLGNEAQGKGVDFITDLPPDPIVISGLEARLAQVFVNLITNALSFCEDGDAIRVWARHRDNRVLVVVEDTGPGIPEEALTKIFNRFYSERPEQQFGNNSGLGLAISKQIVEAHGGVIWAENIRPTDADFTSEPLGARFVVGLPV